ncbi:MAG: glutathione S-transferase family protein [Roseobacter sp.]
MYKVIGASKSRALRVLWMLEELGAPYEHLAVAPRSVEAVAYNPSGKIPALVDGETVLTDSMAIITYLADKHGKLTAPAGTLARAQQDAITFWLLDEFDAILWAAAKHSFVLPEDMRMPAVKDVLKQEFTASASRLAAKLDGPYLVGSEMSIADILACHCINWSVGAGFPRVDDRLWAYGKNLRNRPAYQAAAAK